MKIINLTQTQYRNYSKIHSKRNFGQTIEYSMLAYNSNKRKNFIGLVDNENNIHAAALILIHNVSPTINEAIAPNGFLIDYSDFYLVNTFTEELKKYLLREKVTYLITNPMFKLKVYNKNNSIIANNTNILDNLLRIDYKSLGYTNKFEKHDVIIENNNSTYDIYKNFNRNTKRNIKEAIDANITLRKGKKEELQLAYDIFKKKTNNKFSFYQNLLSIYNNNDNKMEIFFAELNPNKYLIKAKKLYETELKHNEQLKNNIKIIQNKNLMINEKLLNKKINSDQLLEKYHEKLNEAIKLSQKYNDNIIVGTSLIIRNNNEIYFLIDGYKEEFRKLHTTHILKWAIIKKYYTLGYRIFNLGEIYNDYQDKASKYYGQYTYKIGFGGNIIEYPPNLLLIVNKPLYSTYTKLKKFKIIK